MRMVYCTRCFGLFLRVVDDHCPNCNHHDERYSDAAGSMDTRPWFDIINFEVEISITDQLGNKKIDLRKK